MDIQVLIIGSGPGGYVAAIRCAQLGMKVALVEKYASLGGTCLNVGCIPSKALLDSSEHYDQAMHQFASHGLRLKGLDIDMPQMIRRKDEVVDATCKGVLFLMKKNKIEVIEGMASFTGSNQVEVKKSDGQLLAVRAEKIIIATGSKPITPSAFNYDKNQIITSTEALNIREIPGRMVIIGAGVIGLELGSVFSRLGTKVEVIEYLDRILPGMDGECAREMKKILEKKGMVFHLNHSVDRVIKSKKGVEVMYSDKNTRESNTLQSDYCLVAIGRRPYTDGLDLAKAGVNQDEKGRILVNEHLQTNVPHIYAIGDVVRGPMLAHKASEEGILVAEIMAGQKPHIDYNIIPGVVYTWPELAGVGKTEEQLKEEGKNYKTGKFPFKALGRAKASMDTEGFVKVLSEVSTDEILGVHILGARAADLIMEAVSLMEFRASAEDIARISHPHPTFSEAIKEAGFAAWSGKSLHM